MARTLPTPLRVAAGLVGTTVDRITALPQDLPALGVQVVGQAFKVSLRLRQEWGALAARGDEVLSRLSGGPADAPAWATFDEDGPGSERAGQPESGRPARTPRATDPGTPAGPRSAGADGRSGRPVPDRVGPTPPADGDAFPVDPDAPRPPTANAPARDSVTSTAPTPGTAAAGPATPTPARGRRRTTGPVSSATPSVTPSATPSVTPSAGAAGDPPGPSTADITGLGDLTGTTGTTVAASTGTDTGTGPATGGPSDSWSDYDRLTLSALKERLDGASVGEVRALLAREESGRARPAFLTVLGNRIVTLDSRS